MTLKHEDAPPDDSLSNLWSSQAPLTAEDLAFLYPGDLGDGLGGLLGQNGTFNPGWLDLNNPMWPPEDQQRMTGMPLMGTSADGIQNASIVMGPPPARTSFSITPLPSDAVQPAHVPPRNVEMINAQWESMTDLEMDLGRDESRRHSMASLPAENETSATLAELVSTLRSFSQN